MADQKTENESRLPRLDSDENLERIAAILCPNDPYDEIYDDFLLPAVSTTSLQRYYDFLNRYLEQGILLTGQEGMGYFSWEEGYIRTGKADTPEYIALRQRRGSYRDHYKFIELAAFDSNEEDIIAKVVRITDNEKFSIPLNDLTYVSSKGKSVLTDYSGWFNNYRE